MLGFKRYRGPPAEPGDGGNGRSNGVRARAVVTIVSANYLARARALCRSVATHEPRARRFVVLVERRSPKLLRDDEPFEPVWVEDLDIPDLEDFLGQYTVLEANTAVKPFALQYIFEKAPVDDVVYLDPDILVTAPLDEVWRSLDRGSVALTPHLCDPFGDDESPSELDILRSGTYNLGFAAFRRGASAERILEWWAGKMELDCVVDVARGLFVDQKWMDLVPGYVGDLVVLRDPGYNVAYWNLHERRLEESEGRLLVNGRPLAFFHFSGYDVDRPWVLSRHQSRHDLRSLPVVKGLCDDYRARLTREHHDDVRSIPYSYGKLTNGIPLSPALRSAVRAFRRARLDYPSVASADAFCRFVMTPNAAACGAEIAPLCHHVLGLRGDVDAAFPRARHDANDPGFRSWLLSNGHEVEGEAIVARFGGSLGRINPFDVVSRAWSGREDLRSIYPLAFSTRAGLQAFSEWLRLHGVRELDLDHGRVDEFVRAGLTGFEAVVEYYLANPSLHATFPLGLLPCGSDFVEWLVRHALHGSGLTATQVRWFEHRRSRMDVNELLLLTARRNEWVRQRFPLGGTVFGWQELVVWAEAQAAARGAPLVGLAPAPPRKVPMLAQLEALHSTGTLPREPPDALRSGERLRRFADTALASLRRPLSQADRTALDEALATHSPTHGVNVAGYFHYAAGVGSSAHSLIRALAAAKVPHERITLPVNPSDMLSYAAEPSRVPDRVWESHRPDFDVDVTIANGDAMRVARAYVGHAFASGRKQVGYWVWETDRLPGRHADGAEGLDEIWTPSEYSARGLRRTLGPELRVQVVPHAVTVPATPSAKLPISLPQSTTLIGLFFDARSVVERKNPEALVRACRQAFRRDDRVALVLKVSHADAAPALVRRIETLAAGLQTIWLRDVRLDEAQTWALLARLDVYASLHRSEGFGLVLAEAMALGKTVVATGYSANLEFMDDTCARLIHCREIETDRAHGPYPRGTVWAEPDVEHATDVLREVVRDRELRGELGRRARQRVEQRLAPAVVGATIRGVLGWEARDEAATAPTRRSSPSVTPPFAAPPGLPWASKS